jgi:uncharacterized protein with FMN-binding domain
MTRIVTWLLSTLTVVVLLFGYHTSTSGALTTGGSSAFSTLKPADPAGGQSGSGSGSGEGSGSGSGGGSGSGSARSGTVTGSVAQTQWGPVQVQLSVSDGTITDVGILQYPSGNSRDLQINQYALPVLIQETLDQQSAQIDMVSGATVTSMGYVESLQAALDEAGL